MTSQSFSEPRSTSVASLRQPAATRWAISGGHFMENLFINKFIWDGPDFMAPSPWLNGHGEIDDSLDPIDEK